MDYSIIIPAYNEADKIISSLNKVVGYMRTFASFEVVVVDDGSSDNTASLVEEFIKNNPEVRLVKNPHKGKGPTVLTGFREAAGDLIYMCDADLSTPMSELKKLSIWITDQGYDIVIASREGSGAVRVDEPFYRHFMGRVFNLFIRFVALPGINDSQCGFKLFKSSVIKEIASKMIVYQDSGEEIEKPFFGAFDVEMLFIGRKLGYKIKELPVLWNYVGHTGRALIFNTLRMTFDVLKIRINALKGAYK